MADNTADSINRASLVSVPGGAPDPDSSLRAAEALGPPLRVRLQPTVLVGDDHRVIPGVRWSVDFPSADHVRAFHTDLNVWIRAWVKGDHRG